MPGPTFGMGVDHRYGGARSEQIQKLHDILDNLTEALLGEGMQKHFMGSAEYAKGVLGRRRRLLRHGRCFSRASK